MQEGLTELGRCRPSWGGSFPEHRFADIGVGEGARAGISMSSGSTLPPLLRACHPMSSPQPRRATWRQHLVPKTPTHAEKNDYHSEIYASLVLGFGQLLIKVWKLAETFAL